jgi:hypothetical protein
MLAHLVSPRSRVTARVTVGLQRSIPSDVGISSQEESSSRDGQ